MSVNNGQVIYDILATPAVQGANNNESRVVNNPMFISIDGIAAGTTVDIQGKLHSSDSFHSILVVDGAIDTGKLVSLEGAIPFVKTVRTGADNFKVFVSQKIHPGG